MIPPYQDPEEIDWQCDCGKCLAEQRSARLWMKLLEDPRTKEAASFVADQTKTDFGNFAPDQFIFIRDTNKRIRTIKVLL